MFRSSFDTGAWKASRDALPRLRAPGEPYKMPSIRLGGYGDAKGDGMRVTEERLSAALSRNDHEHRLLESNPVAALIVESMAASHPSCSQEIRQAGNFFLDVIGANERDATRLTLPVAMQVLARDEPTPLAEMRSSLAEIGERDLLLGLSIQALLPRSGLRKRRRSQREREAVVRTLYLLVGMFETQEEIDALEQAFSQ